MNRLDKYLKPEYKKPLEILVNELDNISFDYSVIFHANNKQMELSLDEFENEILGNNNISLVKSLISSRHNNIMFKDAIFFIISVFHNGKLLIKYGVKIDKSDLFKHFRNTSSYEIRIEEPLSILEYIYYNLETDMTQLKTSLYFREIRYGYTLNYKQHDDFIKVTEILNDALKTQIKHSSKISDINNIIKNSIEILFSKLIDFELLTVASNDNHKLILKNKFIMHGKKTDEIDGFFKLDFGDDTLDIINPALIYANLTIGLKKLEDYIIKLNYENSKDDQIKSIALLHFTGTTLQDKKSEFIFYLYFSEDYHDYNNKDKQGKFIKSNIEEILSEVKDKIYEIYSILQPFNNFFIIKMEIDNSEFQKSNDSRVKNSQDMKEIKN